MVQVKSKDIHQKSKVERQWRRLMAEHKRQESGGPFGMPI